MLSEWQAFKTNSQIWTVGYEIGLDTAFGTIGKSPKRKGVALFVWGLKLVKLMHGLVHEWEDGQLLKVQF